MRELFSDKSTQTVLLLLLLSFLYTAVSRFSSPSKLGGIVLRAVIFCAWAYSGYSAIRDIRVTRYLFVLALTLYADQLIIVPEVTGFGTACAMIPMFLLRTVAFVAVGVLIAVFYKVSAELVLLNPNPEKRKNPIEEQTLGEMGKEAWQESEQTPRVHTPASAVRYCGRCGHANPDTAFYCGACGERLQ